MKLHIHVYVHVCVAILKQFNFYKMKKMSVVPVDNKKIKNYPSHPVELTLALFCVESATLFYFTPYHNTSSSKYLETKCTVLTQSLHPKAQHLFLLEDVAPSVNSRVTTQWHIISILV